MGQPSTSHHEKRQIIRGGGNSGSKYMKTNSQWYNNPIWAAIVSPIIICILPISVILGILVATYIFYASMMAILELEQLIIGLNKLILDENLLPSIITAMTTVGAGIFIVRLTNKYTEDREKEEKDRKRREANALAIDILASWVHPTFDPDTTDDEFNNYLYEMQIAYWKSALWVDQGLLLMLNKCIVHEQGAPTTNEIVAQTRKYVQGLKEPDITASDIIYWSNRIKKPDASGMPKENAKKYLMEAKKPKP
jgi:hypothetical protein